MPRTRPLPSESRRKNAKDLLDYKRKHAGITSLEQLGDRVDISKATIGRYVRNIEKMPFGVLWRIDRYLKFTDAEILAIYRGKSVEEVLTNDP